MKREDIERLVSDKRIVDGTMEAMKDIRLFGSFDSAVRLGLTVGIDSIPFERAMVFTWIKDLINERKT